VFRDDSKNMTKPRVLFAGTPEFALKSLQALVTNGVVPVAVLTQPDRPAGRGKKLSASPVKKYAVTEGIPVLQPATLRDPAVAEELANLNPDVMIVAAYGLLLPQEVLDLPTHVCLNVHASVLPRWRGAAPIQAAILADDATSGISLMSMTAGLDCGPVFVAESVDIGSTETAGELHDRLAALGGSLLRDNFDAILAGDIEALEQDEGLATYAGKIKTADARLDWNLPADDLCRRVRAYNPVPGAWFMLGDERVKCWRASVASLPEENPRASAGTVVSDGSDRIVVACGEGFMRLNELQRPGKLRVPDKEFVGQAGLCGEVLA
jgi:methionyl-tRNA formyltransferase